MLPADVMAEFEARLAPEMRDETVAKRSASGLPPTPMQKPEPNAAPILKPLARKPFAPKTNPTPTSQKTGIFTPNCGFRKWCFSFAGIVSNVLQLIL